MIPCELSTSVMVELARCAIERVTSPPAASESRTATSGLTFDAHRQSAEINAVT